MRKSTHSDWAYGCLVLTSIIEVAPSVQQASTDITLVLPSEAPTDTYLAVERAISVRYDTVDPLDLCDLHRAALVAVRDGQTRAWHKAHTAHTPPPFDIAASIARVAEIDARLAEIDAERESRRMAA